LRRDARFGANQAAFAIETVIDMLAEKVGIDGWEIRWRNALDVGDMFVTGRCSATAWGSRRRCSRSKMSIAIPSTRASVVASRTSALAMEPKMADAP